MEAGPGREAELARKASSDACLATRRSIIVRVSVIVSAPRETGVEFGRRDVIFDQRPTGPSASSFQAGGGSMVTPYLAAIAASVPSSGMPFVVAASNSANI